MRAFLLDAGVPEASLWVEDRSGSTYENALFSAEILHEKSVKRILLVTDAVHMFRAQRAFEKLGIQVIPAPCGFRPVYGPDLDDLLPSMRAVAWNEDVVHELAGVVWYWLRGRI